MKRIFIILAFLVLDSLFTNAQTLNGFKYVLIPILTYENGQKDVWNISSSVRDQFNKMGFELVTESSETFDEIVNNSCLLLFGRLKHYADSPNAFGGYYSNVELELTDCNNQLVLSLKGRGKGIDLRADLRIATNQVNNQLSNVNYRYDPTKTPALDLPTVETISENESTLKTYFDQNAIDELEGIYKSYQSDQLGYYKIGIKKFGTKYKAIIIESDFSHWKKGEVKALFESSSMMGFYSVKWYMGNKSSLETFAMMDNPALLSIEFKNPETGEKRNDKFIKMYPQLDEERNTKLGPKSSGSGFFVTSNGIIATNAHVVENIESLDIQISNEMGKFDYSAKVLLIDNQNDVALIQIDDPHFKGLSDIPYSLVEQADIGEKVFTIGYPLNTVMGSNYKVTDGIVSSASGISDDLRYYQISVPLQPGNSGGPLFNKNGDVIGITSAQLNGEAVGTNIENVNYAVKISYLINLYKMLPNIQTLETSPNSSSEELQQQVKNLKNYVCLINVN